MPLPNKVEISLSRKIWLFSHTLDRSEKIMVLSPTGNITGYNGANEFQWCVADSNLYFLNPAGEKSIRFSVASRSLGKLVLEGEFLDPNLGNMRAWLQEAVDVQHLSSVPLREVAIEKQIADPSQLVTYRPSTFGDRSLDGNSYSAPAYERMVVENVSLISRFGAARIGDRLIAETAFQHPFFLTHNLVEDGNIGYLHRRSPDTVSLDKAFYACGGIYDNYYHWLMFLMAKLRPQLLQELDTIVISQPNHEFQRACLSMLLKKHGLKAIYLRDNVNLNVGELTIAQQLDTEGLHPHPKIMEPFQEIKSVLGADHSTGSDRIYISRSDTTERRLKNEPEIESILAAKGFAIVSFAGRTLEEQIRIMHNARVVISPHGAGLTNVVFCRQGATILELQNPSHINWCMKRLATISGLNYGYVMGMVSDIERKDFETDIVRLEMTLQEMGL